MVLKDISLEVSQGETVVIRGENGCGKSTLVKILSGLYDDYQGSILINGVELKTLKVREWRNCLIVVPQDAPLFDESVSENINLPSKEYDKQKIDEIIKAMELTEIANEEVTIGELGERISGGQRQRICLGWLYVRDALLIILDEPTAYLDREAKCKLLKYLTKNTTTKIIITHDEEVLSIADKVYNF